MSWQSLPGATVTASSPDRFSPRPSGSVKPARRAATYSVYWRCQPSRVAGPVAESPNRAVHGVA